MDQCNQKIQFTVVFVCLFVEMEKESSQVVSKVLKMRIYLQWQSCVLISAMCCPSLHSPCKATCQCVSKGQNLFTLCECFGGENWDSKQGHGKWLIKSYLQQYSLETKEIVNKNIDIRCQLRDRRTVGTSYRATGIGGSLSHCRSETVRLTGRRRNLCKLWRKAAPMKGVVKQLLHLFKEIL